MKWKIFPPSRAWWHQCSSQELLQLSLRSPRAAGHEGNTERAWAPPETETSTGKIKLLFSPQKMPFQRLLPGMEQDKLSSWVTSVSSSFKTRLLICHLIHKRNEILALFDHTVEPVQHLKADYSLTKTLDIFMSDHLLNGHLFLKKILQLLNSYFFSERLSLKPETSCALSKGNTLLMLLLTATNYSCHMKRKKHLDDTIKNPQYFSQGHMSPTCKVNPSFSLFNFLRRRIYDRSCANAFDWANFPTSLAGSTLTTTWEKQWQTFNKKNFRKRKRNKKT